MSQVFRNAVRLDILAARRGSSRIFSLTAFNVSYPGEVIFRASYNIFPDEDLVVEADGAGGATLLVVEGNYPIDYLVKAQHEFDSEEEACEKADQMAE
jgi:hypothetical protein